MELAELPSIIPGFVDTAPREMIQIFAWHLHNCQKREVFSAADIRKCYADLHMADPGVSTYLPRMVAKKDLVPAKGGYKLQYRVRIALDAKYGVHQTVIQVSKLLADLPRRVSDGSERHFLTEAIKCYRIEAYRATIVMVWNLAYGHLLYWLLADAARLQKFNSAIAVRYPKKQVSSITKYEDFLEELKESEVIEICNTASVLTKDVVKVLREKLGKRNTAAHPNSLIVVQSQADDVITDLVNNVVLALV
jgi:hypothetical protein